MIDEFQYAQKTRILILSLKLFGTMLRQSEPLAIFGDLSLSGNYLLFGNYYNIVMIAIYTGVVLKT